MERTATFCLIVLCLVGFTEALSRGHLLNRQAKHRRHSLEEFSRTALDELRKRAIADFNAQVEALSVANNQPDLARAFHLYSAKRTEIYELEKSITGIRSEIATNTAEIRTMTEVIATETKAAREVVWNQYELTHTIAEYDGAKSSHYRKVQEAESTKLSLTAQNIELNIELQELESKLAAMNTVLTTLEANWNAMRVASQSAKVTAQKKEEMRTSLKAVRSDIDGTRFAHDHEFRVEVRQLAEKPISEITSVPSGFESAGGKFVQSIYEQLIELVNQLKGQLVNNRARKTNLQNAIVSKTEEIERLTDEQETLQTEFSASFVPKAVSNPKMTAQKASDEIKKLLANPRVEQTICGFTIKVADGKRGTPFLKYKVDNEWKKVHKKAYDKSSAKERILNFCVAQGVFAESQEVADRKNAERARSIADHTTKLNDIQLRLDANKERLLQLKAEVESAEKQIKNIDIDNTLLETLLSEKFVDVTFKRDLAYLE